MPQSHRGKTFSLWLALLLGKKRFCFSQSTRMSSTVCGYPLNSLTLAHYGDEFEHKLFTFIQTCRRESTG